MTGRKTPSYLLTLIICMSRDAPGGREESAADAVRCSDDVERASPQNVTSDQHQSLRDHSTGASCSRTQYCIYTGAFCFSCRALMPVSGRVNFRHFANQRRLDHIKPTQSCCCFRQWQNSGDIFKTRYKEVVTHPESHATRA